MRFENRRKQKKERKKATKIVFLPLFRVSLKKTHEESGKT